MKESPRAPLSMSAIYGITETNMKRRVTNDCDALVSVKTNDRQYIEKIKETPDMSNVNAVYKGWSETSVAPPSAPATK
jgi:hypothetical protein